MHDVTYKTVLQALVEAFNIRIIDDNFHLLRKIQSQNCQFYANNHQLFQVCGIVTCRSRMAVSVFLRTYFQGVRRQQSKIDEGNITHVKTREDRKWSREGIT